MDDRPYFYRLRGRSLGPVGLHQIRQLAQRAQIGPSTEVSRDGVNWVKASDFQEIFVVVPGSAPPVIVEDMPRELPPQRAQERWFYTINGNQQGPVDLSTLQQLVANGSVSPDEHAIPEGGAQWMTISSVPQLAGQNRMPMIVTGNGYRDREGDRPPVHQTEGTNGMAIAGFVLSLLGCGLLALIFSLIALNSKNRANRGLAIAGAIIGGIVTLLQILWAILVIAAVASA